MHQIFSLANFLLILRVFLGELRRRPCVCSTVKRLVTYCFVKWVGIIAFGYKTAFGYRLQRTWSWKIEISLQFHKNFLNWSTWQIDFSLWVTPQGVDDEHEAWQNGTNEMQIVVESGWVTVMRGAQSVSARVCVCVVAVLSNWVLVTSSVSELSVR